MTSKLYKILELVVLFISVPISFLFNFSPFIKLFIGVFGFAYVVYVLLKVEQLKFKISTQLNWKLFFRETIIKLLIIITITTFFVWVKDKSQLFFVLKNKPLLWITILFIYSFFSVYPQELIYRTFFFKRYQVLVKSSSIFIFINALVFALAHLLFKNTLVLILTFLGGLLFAYTFKKTKSTLLVSIEHAIYGCWLFTVGMGDMLGFPS